MSTSSTTGLEADDQIKQHIVHLVNEWCEKMKHKKNQHTFQLKEDLDYDIIVHSISNKVIIKCQCGIKATLGQKDNNFIVSQFSLNIIIQFANKNRDKYTFVYG